MNKHLIPDDEAVSIAKIACALALDTFGRDISKIAEGIHPEPQKLAELLVLFESARLQLTKWTRLSTEGI